MRTIKRVPLPRSVAVTTLAIAMLAVGPQAFAGTTTMVHHDAMASSSTAAMAPGWVSPDMRNLAAGTSRLLETRLRTAQNMVADGHYKAAVNELDAALDTAGAIHAIMPSMLLVDQIRIAKDKLNADTAEGIHAELAPVYQQLKEMALYAPKAAATIRTKLRSAETLVNGKQVGKAEHVLQQTISWIRDNADYVPVDNIYGRVATAKYDLSRRDINVSQAKKDIGSAIGTVVAAVHSFNNSVDG